MTKDLNKGISSISYNLLNLPNEITHNDGNMEKYIYRADGNKLRTTYTVQPAGVLIPMTKVMQKVSSSSSPASIQTLDYCGNTIYDNGSLSSIQIQGGFITRSGNQYEYHYYIADHLGNNRIVASNDGTIEQTNHYYPFGALFGESTNDSKQRYKYNGKELDRMNGLNLYDYGARNFDAALTRWTCVDPMCKKYYSVSPYAYCMNNPTKFIDPDGKDPGDYFASMDAAANDFGMTFNDNSIRGKVEYGSTIFIIHDESGQIGYTYTIPNVGNNGKVTVSSAPWGTEKVADVHSHGESSAYNETRYYDNDFSGARDGNGNFHSPQQNMSEQTKGDIRSANQNKRPSYLTTPNGSLQKYDPKTGVIKVINNNMPSDSKDPTRKNKVSSSETKNYKAKDYMEWNRIIEKEAVYERCK